MSTENRSALENVCKHEWIRAGKRDSSPWMCLQCGAVTDDLPAAPSACSLSDAPTPLASKEQVYRLEELQQSRLKWAAACPCSCAACEQFHDLIRDQFDDEKNSDHEPAGTPVVFGVSSVEYEALRQRFDHARARVRDLESRLRTPSGESSLPQEAERIIGEIWGDTSSEQIRNGLRRAFRAGMQFAPETECELRDWYCHDGIKVHLLTSMDRETALQSLRKEMPGARESDLKPSGGRAHLIFNSSSVKSEAPLPDRIMKEPQ